MVEKTNPRYLWADVIRITAIFLVVVVHNLFFLPENTKTTLWIWVPFLYGQLGVPLFVMISGALLLGKNESLKAFFQKRVSAVVIPWIFWIGVYICVNYFFFIERPDTFGEWVKYIYQMFFSRFWFLPMIVGLYLLTPIFKVLIVHAQKHIVIYSLLLWYSVFALLPAFYKVLGLQLSLDSSLLRQVFQYSGLFVLGYFLVWKNYILKPLRFWAVFFVGSMVATYSAVFVLTAPSITDHSDPFFYKIFSPTMVPGIISFFMILFYLSKKWDKTIGKKSRSLLQAMSEAALGIYLVHELVQDEIAQRFPFIDQVLFTQSPFVAVGARALIVFSISFLIIALIRKIPIVKYAT